MVVRPLARFAAVIGGTLLVMVLLGFTYREILAIADRVLSVFTENTIILVVSIYLLFFLALLAIRYFVLLLYSYLEHIEYLNHHDALPAHARDGAALPMVTLVVPAFNEGPVIQSALRALLQLDYPNYEIIVVDDGSTDDTYDRATEVARESTQIPIRVITKKNGGKADALNVGMMHARGELVLNMDGDTKLSSNTLRACVARFEDPQIGAVAGNVKVYNRENVLTRIQALEYVEGLAMARKAQSFMRSVNIIPGPLGMFRKSVLQQVGGYDHDTFAEDCDLTLKILMKGWHVAYEPSAVAWVETPSRMIDLLKQRYRWTRGILQAIRKHRDSLWHPRRAGVNCFILWYMLFEGILWPISNVLGNVFFVFIGLYYGLTIFIFYWWLQLTMLDVIAAAYCVIIEKDEPSLIYHAVLFRLYYILVIDVAKVFATIEEWRGTHMTWGKLAREGKL